MLPRHYTVSELADLLAMSDDSIRAAIDRGELAAYRLGHAPDTMTGHYARPDAETLRPWVERWYAEVVGDVGARAKTGA